MQEFKVKSSEKNQMLDITAQVKEIIKQAKLKQGLCLVYVPHATAAIIVNENYDPNVMQDTLNCLKDLVLDGKWLHDKIDQNGAAHIKAAMLGPSEQFIIEHEELVLGRWQDIMLAEFDGPRERKVYIQIIKKNPD